MPHESQPQQDGKFGAHPHAEAAGTDELDARHRKSFYPCPGCNSHVVAELSECPDCDRNVGSMDEWRSFGFYPQDRCDWMDSGFDLDDAVV